MHWCRRSRRCRPHIPAGLGRVDEAVGAMLLHVEVRSVLDHSHSSHIVHVRTVSGLCQSSSGDCRRIYDIERWILDEPFWNFIPIPMAVSVTFTQDFATMPGSRNATRKGRENVFVGFSVRCIILVVVLSDVVDDLRRRSSRTINWSALVPGVAPEFSLPVAEEADA